MIGKVRWKQYGEPKFIKLAVERYRMMLTLKKTYPKLFVVPTYDMDIIWHTHLGFTRAYEKDCERIVGWILTHDDTVNDRSEGSKLNTCADHTVRLWSKEYATSWRRKGGMYVGEPPLWFWSDREMAAGVESSAWPIMEGPPKCMSVMTAGAAMGNDGRLDLPPLQNMPHQLPAGAEASPATPAMPPSHGSDAAAAPAPASNGAAAATEQAATAEEEFTQCCCCKIKNSEKRPSTRRHVKLTTAAVMPWPTQCSHAAAASVLRRFVRHVVNRTACEIDNCHCVLLQAEAGVEDAEVEDAEDAEDKASFCVPRDRTFSGYTGHRCAVYASNTKVRYC